MEGIMVVPPDRGTIIGRALWKPRFVVVGPQRRGEQPTSATSRIPTPKESPGNAHLMYLSVYKSRSDWEPIQQHHISSVTDCQIQMVAHRKQGPVLPTLVITVSPDPATDKLRKRRSSRTAGLSSSSKEVSPNSLWFRPGDDNFTLQDWAKFIQAHMQPHAMLPMSPATPASPVFMNPFAPRQREPSSDYHPRPPSERNPNNRGPLQHKVSAQTYSSRDHPMTYSDSPSLRSKRSDISSHASVMNQSHSHIAYGHGHYASMHPADLPSPATTIGDYQGEFIEGWTAAQGRSSTLSSPVRGRDSIGSQVIAPSVPATVDSSSPPGPRETILDRAFQLRCIPGSENEIPGEEKLSSLARFEALMQEADRKRERRHAQEKKEQSSAETLKSAWDLDEESEEDDDEDDLNDDEEDAEPISGSGRQASQRHGHGHGHGRQYGYHNRHQIQAQEQGHEADLDDDDDDVLMPPTAQRALDFITGRSSPAQPIPAGRALSPRSPVEYDHNSLLPMHNSGSSSSHLRPTLGPRTKSGIAQRSHSQPQIAGADNTKSSSCTDAAPPSSSSLSHQPSPSPLGRGPHGAVDLPHQQLLKRSNTEKRLSSSSTKRLSITELTKRLSSTSSLLLMQTNASNASSRGSTESDATAGHNSHHQQQHHPSHQMQSPKGTLYPRGMPPPPAQAERCGWRGSMGGVFGTEGGFL